MLLQSKRMQTYLRVKAIIHWQFYVCSVWQCWSLLEVAWEKKRFGLQRIITCIHWTVEQFYLTCKIKTVLKLTDSACRRRTWKFPNCRRSAILRLWKSGLNNLIRALAHLKWCDSLCVEPLNTLFSTKSDLHITLFLTLVMSQTQDQLNSYTPRI